MSTNLENFKDFVKKHPGLNDIVVSKQRTWQNIYEEWTFYKDDRWDTYIDQKAKIIDDNQSKTFEDYEDKTTSEKPTTSSPGGMEDMLKNALGYVKKINPDNITKTVNGVQKLLALISGLGLGTTGALAANKSKMTGDPLFDKRFDEWY